MIVRRCLIALASAMSVASCSIGALDGFSGQAVDAGGNNNNGDGATGNESGSNADGGGGLGDANTATTDSGNGGGDGSSGDGSSGGDGGSGPPGAVFFDTFEATGGLCTPWSASGANAQTNAGGRASAMACRVCLSAAAWGGMRRLVRPVAPATTIPAGLYSFSVWVQHPTYQGSIAFEIYELTAANAKGPYLMGHGSTVSSTWKALQVDVVLPNPLPGFFVDLYLDDQNPSATACFDADDALLIYSL